MAIEITLHAPNSLGGGGQSGTYIAYDLKSSWDVEHTIILNDDGTYDIITEDISGE